MFIRELYADKITTNWKAKVSYKLASREHSTLDEIVNLKEMVSKLPCGVIVTFFCIYISIFFLTASSKIDTYVDALFMCKRDKVLLIAW